MIHARRESRYINKINLIAYVLGQCWVNLAMNAERWLGCISGTISANVKNWQNRQADCSKRRGYAQFKAYFRDWRFMCYRITGICGAAWIYSGWTSTDRYTPLRHVVTTQAWSIRTKLEVWRNTRHGVSINFSIQSRHSRFTPTNNTCDCAVNWSRCIFSTGNQCAPFGSSLKRKPGERNKHGSNRAKPYIAGRISRWWAMWPGTIAEPL